jgi:ABC-type protease/lipase transport system fused ATPase/permease subunit
LHALTQMGYVVSFASDFDGMVRIDFTKEYDKEFYYHEHIGYPGQELEKLEKGITECLSRFHESPPANQML